MYEIYWRTNETGLTNSCKCKSIRDAQILWDALSVSTEVSLMCLRP